MLKMNALKGRAHYLETVVTYVLIYCGITMLNETSTSSTEQSVAFDEKF